MTGEKNSEKIKPQRIAPEIENRGGPHRVNYTH